jgi:hypothetical protein
MSWQPALEHRYRRLLAWFPAEHRRNYEEEMVGVLLAAASDGQRLPRVAETLDLIRGAVTVRMRAIMTAGPDPGWRDALSLTSLLMPILLAVLLLGQNLGWMALLLWHGAIVSSGGFTSLWPAAVLLIPLVLALAGARRIAAASTILLIGWITAQAALGGRLADPRFAAYLVALGVQAAALAASPGPRHALRLISVRAILVSLPWLAFVAYAADMIPTHYPVPLILVEIAIAVVALGALPGLASARGRRLLILLAGIPGAAFVVSLLTFASIDFYDMSFAASQFALYLPSATVAGLALIAIRRSASGQRLQDGQSASA